MFPSYEKKKIRQGFECVIGCDEVGRGSLAGPVVAAAVMLPVLSIPFGKLRAGKYQVLRETKDSKLLSPKKREILAVMIKQNSAAWSVAEVSPSAIDKLNIHQATLLAMHKAVKKLLARVSSQTNRIHIVIDGKFAIPALNVSQLAVIGGDGKILSVAAASIIAKVYRDNLMRKFAKQYPEYNFARHKGYGTLLHRKMILKHGLSPIHRRSFCKKLLSI